MLWKYLRKGQLGGPVPEEELVGMINSGQLTGDDWAYHPKMNSWISVKQVQGELANPSPTSSAPAVPAAPVKPTGTAEPVGRVNGNRPPHEPTPANGRPLGHLVNQPHETNRRNAKLVWTLGLVGGGLLMLLLVIIFWPQGNAWELQNKSRLISLRYEAKISMCQGHFEEAVAKYESIFGVLGDRGMTDPELAQTMMSAATELEQARAELRKQKQLAYVRPTPIVPVAAPTPIPPPAPIPPTPVPPAPILADTPTPLVEPAPTSPPGAILALPTAVPAAPLLLAASQPAAQPNTSPDLQRLDRDIVAKQQSVVSAENELAAIELRGQREITCTECNGKGYKEKTVTYWYRNDGVMGDHRETRIERIPCKRCNETGKVTPDAAVMATKARSQQRVIDQRKTELEDLKKLRDQEWNRINSVPAGAGP